MIGWKKPGKVKTILRAAYGPKADSTAHEIGNAISERLGSGGPDSELFALPDLLPVTSDELPESGVSTEEIWRIATVSFLFGVVFGRNHQVIVQSSLERHGMAATRTFENLKRMKEQGMQIPDDLISHAPPPASEYLEQAIYLGMELLHSYESEIGEIEDENGQFDYSNASGF